MGNVLLLTMYPIENPRHGGQHRAHNIMKKYESCGLPVTPLYVACETDNWGVVNSCFVLDQKEIITEPYIDIREVYDFTLGSAAANSQKLRETLSSLLKNGNYEIIHIEQPWLFESIYRLRCENPSLFYGIRMVYGSQNIEHELKSSMIDRNHPDYDKIIEDIKNVEINAAAFSDYVLAVSKHDQNKLLQYNPNTFLAQNGVGKKTVTQEDFDYVKNMIGEKPYFLFVGSAHKPNCDGFIHMIGGALGCIPPHMNMVVVGGVNVLFDNHDEFIKWKDLNKHKIKQLYDVTDGQLQVILNGSQAILLPICSGGGTNLKTAEALVSNKYIIGTEVSFRDFESYIDESVCIARTRKEFQSAIRNFVPPGIEKKRKDCHLLLWEHTLGAIETIVRDVQ